MTHGLFHPSFPIPPLLSLVEAPRSLGHLPGLFLGSPNN